MKCRARISEGSKLGVSVPLRQALHLRSFPRIKHCWHWRTSERGSCKTSTGPAVLDFRLPDRANAGANELPNRSMPTSSKAWHGAQLR
eukprot:6040674-Amphidinium_carterae.1